MELIRALGALAESPSPALRPLAELCELGPLPSAVQHSDCFLFQLYPYASVYLGAEGMLGGEARDRIAGFWRALGQHPPSEPDHLTTLLGFYARLCELEGAAYSERRAARERARQAFLYEHLLSWLPFYLNKLGQIAAPFYQRWSSLLTAALDEEMTRGAEPVDLPLHLRQAPVLSDPRIEGGKAFLEALLSPVRSGLILVRSDFARAARDLELGYRLGERRFVLEALFAQDASATLRWLAREARRVEGCYRQFSADSGSIHRFWRQRAAFTATLLEELADQPTSL